MFQWSVKAHSSKTQYSTMHLVLARVLASSLCIGVNLTLEFSFFASERALAGCVMMLIQQQW